MLTSRTRSTTDPSDEDEDEEEFIYPGSFRDDGTSVITRLTRAPVPPRPAIPQRHSSTASVAASIFGATAAPSEYGGYAPSVVSGPSRSADLAASTEFRVPMNEAPNKAPLAGRGPVLRPHHLQPQWERDEDVQECRGCSRRFTFFLRKVRLNQPSSVIRYLKLTLCFRSATQHHCRRCGRIYCDSCSSRRAQLGEDELIVDPSMPEMFAMEALGHSRICNACDAERQLPPVLRNPRGAEALLRRSPSRNGSIREDELGDDVAPGDVSSRASELNECPVCSTTLAKLGSSEEQEAHVRACLENGGGGSIQGGRYLGEYLPDLATLCSFAAH